MSSLSHLFLMSGFVFSGTHCMKAFVLLASICQVCGRLFFFSPQILQSSPFQHHVTCGRENWLLGDLWVPKSVECLIERIWVRNNDLSSISRSAKLPIVPRISYIWNYTLNVCRIWNYEQFSKIFSRHQRKK